MTGTAGRLLAMGLLLALVVPAGAQEPPTRERTLSSGLVHQLWGSGDVHVARADPGGAAVLRVAQAATLRDQETPSALCRRTPGCRVAVNGDYFDADGPRGGVAVDGHLLRSPRPGHLQLQVRADPVRAVRPTTQEPGWTGSVAGASGRVRLGAVNAPAAGLVLWTAAYAATTPACTCRELALRQLGGDQVDRLGGTSRWRVVGAHEGGSASLRDGPVLAASGAALPTLDRLAVDGELVLQLGGGASQAVGGHPLLLRDGKVVPVDPADAAQHERHPRTALGWHADGRRWLLVADGRREDAPGLTAAEVAALLRRLGATDAALLDGGGSSTFVVDGKVTNRPSDGQERPVSNALLFVERPKAGPSGTAAALTAGPPAAPLRAAAPAPAAPVKAAVPVRTTTPATTKPAVARTPVVTRAAQAPQPVEVTAPHVDTAQVVAVAAAAIAAAVEADPALRRAPPTPPPTATSPVATAPVPSPLPAQVAALLVGMAGLLVARSLATGRAGNAV